MYYKYEIKNNGKEDLLYLYLNMDYEFSSELGLDDDKKVLAKRTRNFIRNNNIDFNGDKIYLVINDIIVRTIDINNDLEAIEVLDEKKDYSNKGFLVSVEFDNGTIVDISMRDYLMGVIATNMIPDLESDALKSMCVLYRTYAYKEMLHEKKVKASNKFQLYKPISYFKLLWINNYKYLYSKIESAVDSTDKMFLSYNDGYIYPFVHITNNGSTDTDREFPYLSRVDSLWDFLSPYYMKIHEFTINQLVRLLGISKDDLGKFKIEAISEGRRIKRIKVGDKFISGKDFKHMLGLNGEDNTIIINPHEVKIVSRGHGNNLGLSQFGANELSKSDCNFMQILKYYFPLCQLKKYL